MAKKRAAKAALFLAVKYRTQLVMEDKYEDNVYPPEYSGMNEKPFIAEAIREPADGREWYEAVCTEFIWMTGRTLFVKAWIGVAPVENVLDALINRGATPYEAANYIATQLGLKRSDSNAA